MEVMNDISNMMLLIKLEFHIFCYMVKLPILFDIFWFFFTI